MNPIITNMLSGACGGLVMSGLGYLRKPEQKFDLKKFVPTIAIGVVYGTIAGYKGIDYGMIENATYAGTIAQGINWGWKALWRKWLHKLFV